MSLERHKEDWERLAEVDPLWAVLTAPDRRRGGWDEEAFFATGEEEIEHVLGVIESGRRPLARGAALDFGCGVGRLTRALCRRFDRVVGVDISEAMLAEANRLNDDPACEFQLNTAPDLRLFESDSFDFVYSSNVLQHLPSEADIEFYVAEFLRVTRPSGLVVFGVPEKIATPYVLQTRRRIYSLLRGLGVSEGWMLQSTPLTPMRMTAMSGPRVRALLRRHGGALLEAETTSGPPVRTVRYYVAPSER